MSSAGGRDETSRLEPWQETKLGVPKNGGGWWWRLQPFKDNLGNIPAGAFLVSWDGMKGGSKVFGYYESAEQYNKHFRVNKLKCGYELLLAGTPWAETKAYGNIEWEGKQDTEHSTARELLRRLHKICETKLGHLLEVSEGEDTNLGGFKPEVYVLCCTRETKVAGGWKNSYHFIIANLYARQCLDVKQLFNTEMFRTGVNDDFLVWHPSGEGAKPKPIIDPAVYATAVPVPFRRINADPFDPEDDLTASFADDDFAAILPSLISIVDKSKPTMKLLKETPKEAGKTRTSAHASLDAASGRDARPRTSSTPATPITYSLKLAGEVADWLVATHPDAMGGEYQTWRNAIFAALDTAGARKGAPPEFVKILKEWTRIADSRPADYRDSEWARIEGGTFASKEGITMGSLVFNQKQYPAACTSNRAINADPLPNGRALLAPEDVEFFDLFEKFLRHVVYRKTSFKWLVQFASYVVPTLKAQVYDTIQGGYEGITEDGFDLVATTADQPDGEATADGTSTPQEAVTIISHVRTSKPKARAGAPKRYTKKEVITLIIKISPSVHSLEAPGVFRKAIRGALTGQKDADMDTEELLGLSALLQGKSSKTGAQTNGAAGPAQESIEDDAEGHSKDDDSMEEEDTEGGSTDDASMAGDDDPEEHSNDVESMEGSDAEGNSKDVPMPDAGAGEGNSRVGNSDSARAARERRKW
ncbi:hypothetical protein T484DRAFT_3633078 [Baffinella frigidus]|nr:hypothetical protein T484DRAFT_3633078 [Cryptophyta sp. CCMP2293]